MKKIAILAVACAAAINFSNADVVYNHAGDFYLPLSFGWYSPATARDLQSNAVGGVGLGYNINNYLAMQTNGFFFALPEQQTNPSHVVNSYYWDLEGRVNLANYTAFTPYAILGAGWLHINSSQFAWDYGLGLNVGLTPSWAFDASWRQIAQLNPTLYDNMALAGVTYTFGAAAAVPVAAAPIVAMTPTTTQQKMLQVAQTSLKSILPAGVVLCQGGHVGNQPGCVTFEGNQMTMHLNVKFMKAQYAIQSQYGTPIQSLGTFMNAYPKTNVTLYGYASSEGTLAFNQKLSTNRALAVKKYLVKHNHIAASRISTQGMGIQNPLASNANKAGRQLNRRVEATLPVPVQLVEAAN